MSGQALTCVFWDVGDSPVPEEFVEDPDLIYRGFQSALKEKGYHGELSFECYAEETLSDDLLLKYQNAKITLHADGGKDNRVRWMVYDIILWVMDHPVPYPEPANLIVISNNIYQDEEFYRCLSGMRARNYNVILVLQQPDDNFEAEAQGSVWPESLLERAEPIDLSKDYSQYRQNMSGQALTCVFWDVEDSPVPEEFVEDPDLIYRSFQSALNEKGYHGELSFRCYAEKTLSDDLLLKYQNAKITLHAEGGKDNRVRWMVYDIILWAMDNPVDYPEPATNIIVISNNIYQDEEFYGCLTAMGARNYNVFLVQQPDDNFEAEAQGSVWPASLLERGEPIDLSKDYSQ